MKIKYFKFILVFCVILNSSCGGGGGSGPTSSLVNSSQDSQQVSGRVVAFADKRNANAFASTIQADGKILLAGRASGECAIARFNPDKKLDTTFNNTGTLFTSNGTGDCEISSIAAQPDGKILVLNYSQSAYVLSRYKQTGELDNSFGNGGRYVTRYTGYDVLKKGNLSLGLDGNIFVYGFIDNLTIGITKLWQNGELNQSYSNGGVARISLSHRGAERERIIVKTIQDDFLASLPDIYDFYILKISSTASIDLDFGNISNVINGIRGMSKVDFDNRFDTLTGIIPITSGGSYLIGVSSFTNFNATKFDLAVSKLKPDGHLDTGFNQTGRLVLSNYSNGSYKAVSQTDGKLIISDGVNTLRIRTDGTLDPTFKNEAIIPNLFTQRLSNILLQTDGKIVLVGEDFSFVRLTSAGILE